MNRFDTSTMNRVYASMLALGAGVLLYRTIHMIVHEALVFLVAWVAGLLVLEMIIDLLCILFMAAWFIEPGRCRLALRFATVATLLHAFRVLIFTLGRTGPWLDFDVKPEYRALHPGRWNWNQVYFASIMSFLGLLVVVLIWRYRRVKG